MTAAEVVAGAALQAVVAAASGWSQTGREGGGAGVLTALRCRCRQEAWPGGAARAETAAAADHITVAK